MTTDDNTRKFAILVSLFDTGWRALEAGREHEAQAAFDEIIDRGNDPSGIFSGFVGAAHIGRAQVRNLRMKRSGAQIHSGPGVFTISSQHGGHLLFRDIYKELFDAITHLERAIEVGQGTTLVYSFLIGVYLDVSQMMGDAMSVAESLDWIEKALKRYEQCPEKTLPIIQDNYALALAFRARVYLNRWRDLDPIKRHQGIRFIFGNEKDKGRDAEFSKEARTSATLALSVVTELGDNVSEQKVKETRKIAEEVLRTLSQ